MKTTQKILGAMMFMATLLCAVFVNAQTPAPTPVQPPTTSIALPFDVAALTNRAELASLAIRHVDHLAIYVRYSGDATVSQNGKEQMPVVIPFNNPVKSFDAMREAVAQVSYQFPIFDANQKVQISVGFTIGDPTNNRWDNDGPSFQTLLFGENNEGKLVESGKEGLYFLDQSTSSVSMRLNHYIRLKLPGLSAVKAVHNNSPNNSWGESLYVNSRGKFQLPVDVVGSGALVLQGDFGRGKQTLVLSLVTGQFLPLTHALVNILLEGSEEIYTFNNPTAIKLRIPSYGGYGITPLLIVKIKVEEGVTTSIPIRLDTTEGILARGYKTVNVATGEEVSVGASAGSTTIKVPFTKSGEYHVIPDLPILNRHNYQDGGNGKG